LYPPKWNCQPPNSLNHVFVNSLSRATNGMLVIVGIIVIFSLVVGSFIMKGRLELRKQRAQQGV
jgi:hypothetical protein